MSKSLSKFWSEFRSRPLIWDTFTTTGWSTIGRGVGFLVPFFIAAWFGATSETDVFFFTYGIILVFTNILSPVIESVIVPYIAESRVNNEDVGKFVGGVLKVGGIVLLIISVLVILFSKPVLSIVTHFSQDSLNLLFKLLIEVSPLMILLVWTSILSGALNAYKKFVFPAVSPAFRAVVNLTLIWIFKDSLGVHAITLGYVGGEMIRLVFLLFVIRYFNLFKLSFSSSFDPSLFHFLKTASYPVLGMVALEFSSIINKTIATWLGEGGVSFLYYAERLDMIPKTLVSTGLLITLLSHWSERYYKTDKRELEKKMKKTLFIVGFLSLLLSLLLILFHKPIVRLAFGRGEFELAKLSEVGKIWIFYLLGFAPYVLARIFIRIQFIRKETKLIMYNILYKTLINILFCIVLARYFGLMGIALAITIASFFEVFYLGIHFYRKVGKEVINE